MTLNQPAAKLADGGLFIGKFHQDRKRCPILGFRLGGLARIREHQAQVDVAARQVALHLGHFRV